MLSYMPKANNRPRRSLFACKCRGLRLFGLTTHRVHHDDGRNGDHENTAGALEGSLVVSVRVATARHVLVLPEPNTNLEERDPRTQTSTRKGHQNSRVIKRAPCFRPTLRPTPAFSVPRVHARDANGALSQAGTGARASQTQTKSQT